MIDNSASLNQLELVAIEYYDKGILSALPNGNPYKAFVEAHYWGYHATNSSRDCPVCVRNRKGQ